MNKYTNAVDEDLWRQCKTITAGLLKKPGTLPNRVGALSGLEEDPDESTIITLVDGDYVKIKNDMDFCETTHNEREPEYCEGIWIDANTPIREWTYYLYRSAHEYREMCQDELSYDVAKVNAQKGERELRLADWRSQGRGL